MFLWFFAKQAELLFNVTTKKFLVKKDIYAQRHPASITKVMTMYILFEALKRKKITMDTYFKVSSYASKQAPCKVYLHPNERVKVKDLIHQMVVHSANDSAVTVAENLAGGDVRKFVKMMNKVAKKIGMKKTHFTNPTGLPDKKQVTTAYDLLRLGYAIYRDHPKQFYHFRKKHFYHKGRTYRTRNRLLHTPGIYGVKTGYTCMSGFNVLTSAVRLDKKKRANLLLAVVMGQETAKTRDEKVLTMINKFYKA